jgi:hypothetical protein
MGVANAVDGSEPQIPETGTVAAAIAAGVIWPDGTLVTTGTRRERLRAAAGRYARHAPSALILYAAPAGVVFVAARGLHRRRASRR